MLENIQKPSDIKDLSIEELNILADEIKSFLVDSLEKTGGHLSSDLGTIESVSYTHLTLPTILLV